MDLSLSLKSIYLISAESIYGQRLTVEFKNKLRDEKKFDNIDLLKEQILQDISHAKEILE